MDQHGWWIGVFAVIVISAVGFSALGAVLGGLPPESPSGVLAESSPDWKLHIAHVDEALARRDMSMAVLAWRRAQSAAFGSRGWEPMAELGDAAVRIAARDSLPSAFQIHARDAYLAALFRARAARSVAGLQRVADAFSTLNDHGMAAQARATAESMEPQRLARPSSVPVLPLP